MDVDGAPPSSRRGTGASSTPPGRPRKQDTTATNVAALLLDTGEPTLKCRGNVRVEDREVALLVLGLLVLGFLLSHWRQLRVLPWWPLLMASASLLVMGWLLTVVEHLGDFPVLNVAEHALYTVHSILLAIWAVRLQKGRVAR